MPPRTLGGPADNHYAVLEPQPMEVIEDWLLGYHAGNCLKYVARHDLKGRPRQDLEKSLFYARRARDLCEPYRPFYHGASMTRVRQMVKDIARRVRAICPSTGTLVPASRLWTGEGVVFQWRLRGPLADAVLTLYEGDWNGTVRAIERAIEELPSEETTDGGE